MRARRVIKGPKTRPRYKLVFSAMQELMASPTEPLPQSAMSHHLIRMYEALNGLERGDGTTADDWETFTDAVNIMDTLIRLGVLDDPQNRIDEVAQAMVRAVRKQPCGDVIYRLDGPGMQCLRALLEDYSEALKVLPQRVVISAHRKTEKRIQEIRRGIKVES